MHKMMQKSSIFSKNSKILKIGVDFSFRNGIITATRVRRYEYTNKKGNRKMKMIALILGLTATVAVGNTLPPTPEAPVAVELH